MKMQYLNPKRLVLAAALLLGACGASAQETFSPGGTWDLIIGGAEKGVAYFTFEDFGLGGGSLSGYEVIMPTKPGEDIEAERNDGTTASRGVTGPGPTPNTIVTNLIGFGLLSGTWSYDIKGNVIGVYTEGGTNQVCTTNDVTITNYVTDSEGMTNGFFITTTQVITCVASSITNGVSFTAIVRPDRITIKTKGHNGSMVLKGIPAVDAPDLTGSYYALGQKQGSPNFTEFITLTPSAAYFNGYDVTGQGPAYELIGIALASNKKKLGLVSINSLELSPLSAGLGGINVTKGQATLSTVDNNGTRGKYKIIRQTQ